jgi:3-deoxy-D-manno-oct-2-ulosonic acid (Kdo) hydroxylase
VSNTVLDAAGNARLAAMMDRFATGATTLIRDLLPRYGDELERARASFRPAKIERRAYSLRHDDRLLHVDAYPTRPMRGRRILRVFSNIASDGATREWLVGERFENFARGFCSPDIAPWSRRSTCLSRQWRIRNSLPCGFSKD